MYHHEHEIAQAEHKVYLAKFNRPAAEGYTVRVPNLIDRVLAAVQRAFTSRRPQPREALRVSAK